MPRRRSGPCAGRPARGFGPVLGAALQQLCQQAVERAFDDLPDSLFAVAGADPIRTWRRCFPGSARADRLHRLERVDLLAQRCQLLFVVLQQAR